MTTMPPGASPDDRGGVGLDASGPRPGSQGGATGRLSRSAEVVMRLRFGLVASDPGLARLRTAGTTVFTLAASLGLLYVLTDLFGQTFTVALLGVVISMISSMAFTGPRPLRQVETGGLMLATAAAAVSLGAVLAPHKLAGDVVFVVIMMAATAGRRFGPRSNSAGMVAFMTYFFALFLGATVSLLPWLIGALAVGTGVSLAVHLAFREDPDAQVRRAMSALQSGVALVLDVVTDGVASGRWTERDRGRLRQRMARVSRTALMIDGELQDLDDGDGPDRLALGVFDVELATEHLIGVWDRVASGGPSGTEAGGARDDVLAALLAVRVGMRPGAPPLLLAAVEATGDAARNRGGPAPWRVLHVAVAQLADAVARVRTRPASGNDSGANDTCALGDGSMDGSDVGARGVGTGPTGKPESGDRSNNPADGQTEGVPDGDVIAPGRSWADRLAPSTRQAAQVAVASSLAIVAGTQLSSARWYWAVIAAFTIYSGTTSRGETVTKGWQRVAGTVAGVAVGAVVASLVAGDVTVSIVLIFVALFTGFYLMRISYAFMVLGTSTMLALLYGLLGEFTIGLLVTRIEETAIGAGIGIVVALFILPTSTRTVVQRDLRDVLDGLGQLLDRTARHLAGDGDGDGELTRTGRDLDGRLQALRASTKPLTSGVTSLRTRNTVREGLRILAACDHYARGLTRIASATRPHAASDELRALADHVRDNVVKLAGSLSGEGRGDIRPDGTILDAAQVSIDKTPLSADERRPRILALRYLIRLDQAVVDLAAHLHPGTDGTEPAPTQTSSQGTAATINTPLNGNSDSPHGSGETLRQDPP